MKRTLILLSLLLYLLPVIDTDAQSHREKTLINNDWTFKLGQSGHEQLVSLPHDWAVDLPYSQESDSNNGFKAIGSKFPANSEGWYSKSISIPESDKGDRIQILFEGVFRDYDFYCNDHFIGHESSGYTSRIFDISEYVNWGGENKLRVHVNASGKESEHYEGAGIYRNVYLVKNHPIAVKPFSMKVFTREDHVNIEFIIASKDFTAQHTVRVEQFLYDAMGEFVAKADKIGCPVSPFEEVTFYQIVEVPKPIKWSPESPYLYTLHTRVYCDDELVDDYPTRVGMRDIEFHDMAGMFINGKSAKIKGLNIIPDHAGVGVAIPKALWRYRLAQLKELGCNAVRCLGYPASPDMLDVCDELGLLVIDEYTVKGVNEDEMASLKRMIDRDASHPSVLLWSIGDQHAPMENTVTGFQVARYMTAYAHTLDESRKVIVGNCNSPELKDQLDIFGYNQHLLNNIVMDKAGIGTDDITGAGVRGDQFGSLNRTHQYPNVIERSWHYYSLRSWLAGMFYSNAFDSRGVTNGVLDYCGFPKDEAWFLKSIWSDKPMVYVTPSWNSKLSVEEENELWIYSNCDEIQLQLGGKSIDKNKRPYPVGRHLPWKIKYDPTKNLSVLGFGKEEKEPAARYVLNTPGPADHVTLTASSASMLPDGQDVVVVDVAICDADGNVVDDAASVLDVKIQGLASLLGWGNGDPANKDMERAGNKLMIKTFAGRAQILVRSVEGAEGKISLSAGNSSVAAGTTEIRYGI